MKKKDKTLVKEHEGKELFLESDNLKGSRITEEGGKMYVEDVALLGATSKNKVRYREAKKEAVNRGVYEGVRMYFTHKDGSRDVRDLFGKTVDARYSEADDKVRSRILVRKPFEGEIKSLVEDFSELCGFSHVADCRWKKADEGWKEVTHINEVLSVDLVDRPGTNKSMFEAEDLKDKGGKKIMDLNELKKEHGELLKEHEAEILKRIEGDETLNALKAEVDSLKEKNTKLEEAAKKGEKDRMIRDSEALVESVLKESSLPEKVKAKLKEGSKGKIFKNEAEIKEEIKAVEEICQLALSEVEKVPLPPDDKNKNKGGEAATLAEGLVGRLICKEREEPKKEDEKKE